MVYITVIFDKVAQILLMGGNYGKYLKSRFSR